MVSDSSLLLDGRRYRGQIPFLSNAGNQVALATPSPTPDDPVLKFERSRRELDADPNGWLANQAKIELGRQGVQNPLESSDPEFLYLYGRASMLAGNNDEAAQAFEQAIVKSDTSGSPAYSTVRKEATLALAALAIKSDKERPRALTHLDEMLQKPANSNSP
jgi:tetratricopeptide (TPR) repeat protein